MVLKRPALGDEKVVPVAALVDLWTLRIIPRVSAPDFFLVWEFLAGFRVNFELLDCAAGLLESIDEIAALEVDFSTAIVVEEEARVYPVEINVEGITPLPSPDIICLKDEISHVEAFLALIALPTLINNRIRTNNAKPPLTNRMVGAKSPPAPTIFFTVSSGIATICAF
jgi:hypothetical protein